MAKLERIIKETRNLLGIGILGLSILGCSQDKPDCEPYQETFCNSYDYDNCQGFCKEESSCPENHIDRDGIFCQERKKQNDLEGNLFGSYVEFYTTGEEETFFMHDFSTGTTANFHIDESSDIHERYTPRSHFGIKQSKGSYHAFVLQSNGKLFTSRFDEIEKIGNFEKLSSGVDMATRVGDNLWYVKDGNVYAESAGEGVLINEDVNLPFLDTGHIELAREYDEEIVVAHNKGVQFSGYEEGTLYVMDTLGKNVHALSKGRWISSPILSGKKQIREDDRYKNVGIYLFVKDERIYEIDARGNDEKQKFVGIEPRFIMWGYEGLFIPDDKNNLNDQIYTEQSVYTPSEGPKIKEIELPDLFPINSRHDKFYRWNW